MSGAVVAIRPRTLGDVVLLTPALRALHRGHPQRPLEVVTEPRYASLFEGLPQVARVWPLEDHAGSGPEIQWKCTIWGWFRVVAAIRHGSATHPSLDAEALMVHHPGDASKAFLLMLLPRSFACLASTSQDSS